MFIINSYVFAVAVLPPVEQLLIDINGDEALAALLPESPDSSTFLAVDIEGDSSIDV